MKDRKKPGKFLLPHGIPSDDWLFAFSSRVFRKASKIKVPVGTDLTVAEAQLAAKDALLDILAIVKDEIGDLDKIVSVEKVVGFVRSATSFTEQPMVVDGASDLLISLFGEGGRHARTATGVAQLPFGAAVQLDMILRMAHE